jgi:hypothetical protein
MTKNALSYLIRTEIERNPKKEVIIKMRHPMARNNFNYYKVMYFDSLDFLIVKNIFDNSFKMHIRLEKNLIENCYEDYMTVPKGTSLKMRKTFKNKKPKNDLNHVGIELELVSKLSINEIRFLFATNGLQNNITVKSDASIVTTKAHMHAVEIAIIAAENEFKQVINKVIDLIKDFSKINKSCGLHVHLDARNRNIKHLYKSLYESQNLLYSICDRERVNNNYCKMTNFYEEYGGYSYGGDRYQGINRGAFSKFKTLEVRIMNGSLNKTLLNNYIHLLIKIASKTQFYTDKAFILNSFDSAVITYNITSNLANYLRKRIKKYNLKMKNNSVLMNV